MKVGVYVDAYNLYYAGRGQCGRGVAGWRWLDIGALATAVIGREAAWTGAQVVRVVYCTARISAKENPGGFADQDVYLKALLTAGSVDVIEYGEYVSRVKAAPLARRDSKGRPQLVTPAWPIMVQQNQRPLDSAVFMASVASREEKGSDVNVATRMLLDVLTGAVDAVVVISNDSDLRLPVAEVRKLVHVGTVNPSLNYPAGALNGSPKSGAGGRWWAQLSAADFTGHQLPDPAGKYARPAGW